MIEVENRRFLLFVMTFVSYKFVSEWELVGVDEIWRLSGYLLEMHNVATCWALILTMVLLSREKGLYLACLDWKMMFIRNSSSKFVDYTTSVGVGKHLSTYFAARSLQALRYTQLAYKCNKSAIWVWHLFSTIGFFFN